MKRFLFAFLLFIFCIQTSIGQTLGWIDKDLYKEEQLKIDNLLLVHFNENGTRFYTLHSNKIIYYWDTETGQLLDSLIIPDNSAIAGFSKDGRTIYYYLSIPYSSSSQFNIYISIYNLATKNIITKSSINVPNDINYNRPQPNLGWIDMDRYLTLLDYNYDENLLTCGVTFQYYYATNPLPPFTDEYYITCGGSGVFDVKNDTLILIRQITRNTTYDLISTNNSDYLTILQKNRSFGGTASYRRDNTVYSFNLNKYDNTMNKATNIKGGGYGEYWNWEETKGESSYKTGINKPYTSLFFDDVSDMLFMKADDIYYVISTKNDTVVDSVILINNNGHEKLINNFSDFIYYYQNKLLIHNIAEKIIQDSIDCPIEPIALEVSLDNSNIIVADTSGRILLYRNDKTGVSYFTQNDNISIIPNPATDFIELKDFQYINYKIQIYNVMGVKVLDTEFKNRIDVSGFSTGLYFLKIGDNICKFLKI